MTSDPIISVENVSMVYQTIKGSSVTALSDVNLAIPRGEFVSLIGPSGCGKSSLLHAIGGLRQHTSGEVRINGTTVTGPNPKAVGFVFQDYTLFPWRTVIRNIETGLEFQGVGKRERRERAEQALAVVGLSSFRDSHPGELSGGMQQRIAVARALAPDPDILLMDEPFGALDEQTRTELGMEISRILEATGKTIVFVTHSLGEAVFLSDRIVVMSARPGRVRELIEVSAPRPRTPHFAVTEDYTAIRNHLFEVLHEEVSGAPVDDLEQEVRIGG
jgi:NitT/TauT family transport system ATP-binding protein